jgi:hypothetical protein
MGVDLRHESREFDRDLERRFSSLDWRKEKVSFQSCYGDERVFGYLFLPKGARPPFQCILYSPGADAQTTPSSENLGGFGRVDFIIRSGRAVFWPVIKGEFERRYTQPARPGTESPEPAHPSDTGSGAFG